MGLKFAHLIGAGTRRPLVIGALAMAVLVALVGSVAGYAAMNKDVRLSIDGKTREITVMGQSVSDVLKDQGIQVGPHDLVAPGVDEEIADGSQVTVRYGRPLELTVDGKTSTHWVTATSVSDALVALGNPFARADLSINRSAPISRGGLELEVVTPKTVTVAIAGKKPRTRTITALTVREVLGELDVRVNGQDRVRPGLNKPVADGDRIVFTDIRVVNREVTGQQIGFDTIEREDDSLLEGRTAVRREGRVGLRNTVYRVTFRNGEVVARKALRSTVTRRPVAEIVAVGTKEPAPAPAPAPEPAAAPSVAANFAGGSTVWDQLARCESGGNWAINTGNGYYGGLQFSLSTWQAYGGPGYPHQQSRETQIAIASKVRDAAGGYGAWPHCSAQLGLPR